MALLEVDNLKIQFRTPHGMLHAVNGLSFRVEPGQTLAIVGESGCGKSVTSMAVLGLLPRKSSVISGSVNFKDRNLLDAKEKDLRRLRGNEISMIFQEPMTSLNPVLTIGYQIGEVLRLHRRENGRKAIAARCVEMLELVGISDPKRRLGSYPHELSGGMRQRVMIALALACNPELLIADEPTTALDVTIQAQILKLMDDLKRQLNSAILLITHDLGVVAENAQFAVVMYAGHRVEEAPVDQLFANPRHPYTRGLLGAVPRLGKSLENAPHQRLAEIPGQVSPSDGERPGCAFAERCNMAQEICRTARPVDRAITAQHRAACHFANEVS